VKFLFTTAPSVSEIFKKVMTKIIIATLLFLTAFCFRSNAQQTSAGEKHGKSLNLGVGIGGYSGYYRYVGRSLPVFNINYEFDVAKNFTLAPFISFSSYSNSYYWGDKNKNYPYRYYTYRETVIPIGAKGTYYFDDLLKANSKWDFYLAGSLGFAIVNSSWDSDYNGDRNYYNHGNPLFLNLHIGTEYHFNNHLGAFLDLSTGVSTIGLAIHQL
jgi:hypothetical protein